MIGVREGAVEGHLLDGRDGIILLRPFDELVEVAPAVVHHLLSRLPVLPLDELLVVDPYPIQRETLHLAFLPEDRVKHAFQLGFGNLPLDSQMFGLLDRPRLREIGRAG